MERRVFIKDSFSYAALSCLPLNLYGMDYTSEVHSFEVGELKCSLFKDLNFEYAASDYFINASPDQIKQGLAKYEGHNEIIPSPYVAMLVESGDRNLLIDTGIGYSDKALEFKGKKFYFKGRLSQLLRNAQISNDEITDVVLTHFHPDHIGGVMNKDGELSFPNANIHVHKQEWEFWNSPNAEKSPFIFQHFINENILPLKELNLHFINSDFDEIIPDIKSINISGHTPGQIGLLLDSKGEKLLYISDAFLHPLHIENLNWQTIFDHDHVKALKSRQKVIDLATKEHIPIQAFHFDFPGIGYIQKNGNAWSWEAMD